ncbi:hypothetical protein [Chryseosolibacter indicus]|uniref:Uncharacterized protein n=1 Tax=Chryseosolibacter indicus TaxID=2782351 RepID=A0ABS5VYF9_9BACT|nr:hypothetical protein [Chryseosolibacter indicus]MBT1706443.1 hypothetical protein [Chryseosolibacter indicus]
MLIQLLVIVLFISAGCQTGKIPCPKVKVDRTKKTFVKKRMKQEKEGPVTARITPNETVSQSRTTQNIRRTTPTRPALEHVDVEEWDCPKPGMKKNLPKALKDNIKKNRKAYEAYYKNRNSADSLSSGKLHR